VLERGFAPLIISSLSPSLQGESKRGGASLKPLIPLPLDKGKGIKGIGLLKIKGEGLPNALNKLI